MVKLLLIIGLLFVKCDNNKYYYIDAFDFHFQTDINNIGLKNLKIIIDAEKLETPIEIDSSDFTVCPQENDTCDGKGYYEEVPEYTQTVPMTRHSSENNFIRGSDGKATIAIYLIDKNDTLLNNKVSFEPIREQGFFLIYLGNNFDETNYKIRNFVTCLKGGVHGDKPAHYSFPITGTPEENDSLFLIWME